MHPDSQHSQDSRMSSSGRAQEAGGTDPVVEDFNSFFEKLSSLDSLQWPNEAGGEAPPAPKAPARPARREPATAEQAVPKRAAAPRMTVVQSDRDLEPAPEDVTPAAAADPARGRLTTRDVARFLKLTLVGLLLFALGLGAGWAALSLPGQFEQGLPSITNLMERARSATPMRREAAGASDALRLAPVATVEVPVNQSGTQPAVAASRPTAKPQVAAPSPGVAPAAAADTVAEADDVADAGAQDDGIQLPTVREAPAPVRAQAAQATAAPAAQPAATQAAKPAGEARFALQVGACTSYDCVKNYRNLLLRRVSSGRVKVEAQPGGGSTTIQRVRVEPLGRAEAERLKADLTDMDARFKDAYVVSLR